MTSNLEAAKGGDRLAALVVLRDTLARQLDVTQANIHAQLAPQYRATLAEIAELMGGKPKSGLDELRSRRESKSRGATSDASVNP